MKFIITTLGMILLLPFSVSAIDLDSPGPPTAGSTMPTLQGIYDRLESGNLVTVPGSFQEPAAGPIAGTGVSLNDINSVLPQPDDVKGLDPAEAPIGKTFWSLRTDGTWGAQEGSNANVVDTSSGEALASNILCGSKVWVDGAELTGTKGCIPDTGQTISYTTTSGEDHDYNSHPPSYTDNGDQTVTDNVTGLVWQQVDNATTQTWDAAFTYCFNLSLGAKLDWRLPSIKELLSIADYGNNPTFSTAFPGTTSGHYWASTIDPIYTAKAWYVAFMAGTSGTHNKTSTENVRCVRDGQ